MKKVLLKIETAGMQEIALTSGMNYEENNFKAKEDNGMVTIELPEERACQLLGNDNGHFTLLSPDQLKVSHKKGWGVTIKTILSVAKLASEKKANPKITEKDLKSNSNVEDKYKKLDWGKEQFLNFCEENNVSVPGNWGIARIIKELVSLDSELKVSLSKYLS